jgi:hypothetical protein
VIEEQLGYQTQILGIILVFATIYFKYGNIVLSINLIPGRVKKFALRFVAPETILTFKILQTEFTDVDNW